MDDQYLGEYIEVINQKSKFLGYKGYVDTEYRKNKYKLFLEPQRWENTEEYHILYINIEDAYKWLQVLK